MWTFFFSATFRLIFRVITHFPVSLQHIPLPASAPQLQTPWLQVSGLSSILLSHVVSGGLSCLFAELTSSQALASLHSTPLHSTPSWQKRSSLLRTLQALRYALVRLSSVWTSAWSSAVLSRVYPVFQKQTSHPSPPAPKLLLIMIFLDISSII